MPDVSAALRWQQALQFEGEIGATRLTLDADGAAGPTPVEAMVLALAGCMAVDVADILAKGRHAFTAIDVAMTGDRAAAPPRRLLSASLNFTITGAVPEAAVQRALDLSREKYCSVWHSMRQDIALETRFVIRP
jgi:putative redox protein